MKKNLLRWFQGSIKTTLVFSSLLYASQTDAQCSASITVDTTITCFGDSTGVLSFTPNPAGPPLMISEVDRNSPDLIEIQNVTGATFDATGYYVACSDDYTNINVGNALTWNLTGTVPAGWVDFRDDNTGANYWGNNLFFNGTSSGWVAICDPSHNIIDIIFWDWTIADIATFAPVVGGNTLLLSPANWVGDGFNGGCGTGSMTRSTNLENNNAGDWTCGSGATAGVSNMSVTPVSAVGIASTTWSTGASTTSISNLVAGTYILTVIDSLGCIAADTVVLSGPAQISAVANVTDISCYGDTNGMALLSPSGGLGPITADWGANNPMVLPAGYSVYTLTDSVGCSVTDSVLINMPAVLEPIISATMVPCFGDSTGGMVGTNVLGGVPGYTYLWSTGDTTSNLSNVATGWYSVVVTDSNGCTMTDSVEVTEPAMIVLNGTTTDEIVGNDGSIDLTVSGGTMPYSYAWTNGAPAVEDPTGLAAGSYDVTITDSNGCVMTGTYVVGSQVGINELSEIQFTVAPNPNNGSFRIILDPSEGVSNVEILNALGQLVYANTVVGSTHDIDLKSAESGIYFLRLSNSTSNNVMRIVIR